MKAKVLWIARNHDGASNYIRIFREKPVYGFGRWHRKGVGEISGGHVVGLCPDDFRRGTGISLKKGEGPYRMTITIAKRK